MDSGAELVCSVENTICPVKRSFDAHRDGFMVARLADHDDVWICTQKRAHEHGKVDAGFFVDLHLAQTFLGNLNGVFRCPNFGIWRI